MEPLTVPGTLDSLETIGKYVLAAAGQAGLERKRAYSLRLAVDEIATNIINHGYQEAGLEGSVWLRADVDDQALTISLEDTGAAYDPTTRPPPTVEDITRPLFERPVGGWGVYLAIQNADKFLYRRVDGRNRNMFVMNRAVHGNLLVVHEQQEARETLSHHLGRLGYTVTCVEDSEQALSALAQSRFDLVLLGVDAPGLSVLELLERVMANNALRGIPILVSARQERMALAERCIAAGAEDVLPEPFSPVIVQARVAANLERQRVRIAEQALKQSEKFERDVQIGHQIQLSFLPETLPQPPGWEIAACFEPAREVAGDFYDAFPLTHGRIGLVLGDVCDKGVGAALFMALFRSLIRAFAQQHYSSRLLDEPAALVSGGRRRSLPSVGSLALKNAVELTNNYIIDNHGQTAMFATLFMGILDPDTGTLIYVNAGHEPPVIFTPGHIRDRLRPNGTAVGMLPGAEYEIQTAQLQPGETLLIYTDGVPEAKDPAGQLYTEPRLLSLLDESAPSAKALLDRIEDALRAHRAEAAQYDDITMLAVTRSGA